MFTILIDGGSTHNFVYVSSVTKRQIPVEDFNFAGFNVKVEYGYNMVCTQMIMGLKVTLGNYVLTN
jgi:hypothetical protein